MSGSDSDGPATPTAAHRGPPPLRPFGLVLHRDGTMRHEGQPIRNRKLRELFDRSVVYLPEEGKYVVRVAHFRGQIEVEEAGFFVRDFDAASASVALSDGSREAFDPASLGVSERDGALLCRVKSDLREGGLLARFGQAAQAELLLAVEDTSQGPRLRLAGVLHAIPEI